jgi:alpha-N-arabinofuranosidase
MNIDLTGFAAILPDAERKVLTGDADAGNTFENPQRVVPLVSTLKVNKSFDHTAPAMSFTVIQVKTKK